MIPDIRNSFNDTGLRKQSASHNKIINLGAVLILAFGPYSIFRIPCTEIAALLVGLLSFLFTSRIALPRAYKPFFLYILFIPPLVTILMGVKGNIAATVFPTTLIIFSFCISTIPQCLSKHLFLYYYKILIYVIIFLVIVQYIEVVVSGTCTGMYLPFMNSIYEGMSVKELMSNRERPIAFFSEPAHLVGFVIPYFCYEYSKCIEAKKISTMIIALLIVFLLVKSGTGFFILAFLFVYGLCVIKMSMAKKSWIIVILIISVTLSLAWFKTTDLGSYIFERSIELSGEDDRYQSSGFVRIYRGYQIFLLQPTINKIFGCGLGELLAIIATNPILLLLYKTESDNIMNGLQTLLFSGGIIGTILFFRYLGSFIKMQELSVKTIIITMVAYMLIESAYLNPRMLLFILTAYACTRISTRSDDADMVLVK